jgi:hypothetical protein
MSFIEVRKMAATTDVRATRRFSRPAFSRAALREREGVSRRAVLQKEFRRF